MSVGLTRLRPARGHANIGGYLVPITLLLAHPCKLLTQRIYCEETYGTVKWKVSGVVHLS